MRHVEQNAAVTLTGPEASLLQVVVARPGIHTEELRAATSLSEGELREAVERLGTRGLLVATVTAYASGWTIMDAGLAELA